MLRIDAPADRIIQKPLELVRGWYAAVPRSGAGLRDVQIGGVPVPWSRIRRPDVCEHYPGMLVTGFQITLDLTSYMHAIRNRALAIVFVPNGEAAITVDFAIQKEVAGRCLAASG